jgi:hypothetical protein
MPRFSRRVVLLALAGLGLASPAASAADDLTLRNAFGIRYEPQPVAVPREEPLPANEVMLDAEGRVVGQGSSDGKTAFLHVGFPNGEPSRGFSIAKTADGKSPANAVKVSRKQWSAADSMQAGTAVPNGVTSYFEITNGLCGVRIPATVAEDGLPASQVPTPVIGAMFPGGQWAGRPDFRSFVVPAKDVGNGDVVRHDWRFTSFKGELVEEGPIRTVARVTIGVDNRPEPFVYEVTLFANEQFVKIAQTAGTPNAWFLDLTLDHAAGWRPTRWRSGANHHWYGDGAGQETGVEVPGRPGTSYELKWPHGPGPANKLEYRGEGEGDLWSHDAWVEFAGGQWGTEILAHRHGRDDLQKRMLTIRGQMPWYPWNGVGQILYAFDHAGGPDSPVAGLLMGPAGEITGWNAGGDGGNPAGIVNFSQHVPAWLEADPYGITYLGDWRYEGVKDRTRPIFGVKFLMPMRSGSVFLWLGRNADIIPDIADERITVDYRSKPWLDWARFTSGGANLEDAVAYSAAWPDPPRTGGRQYIEDEVIRRTVERVRAGERLGDWQFLGFWRQADDQAKLAGLEGFLGRSEADIRRRIDAARTTHWGFDGVLQWYTTERSVVELLDTLALYAALGSDAAGGIVPADRWERLKRVMAFYFHHTFDEDRACLWNEGVTINHGGGTMRSPAIGARMGIIESFPGWPDVARFRDRPVSAAEEALVTQIGRYGSQFTATHYASLAAITGPLADLQALQFRSFSDPAAFPDEYARDPRLRHHAHFVLNRMGVKDPRNGNVRVPIAFGNGGAGWGQPAAAELATGFRHIDRPLAESLMWAWRENGSSTSLTPPLPKMIDYDLPSRPYAFPAVCSFPGGMTIHRSGGNTPHETGVWITDGAFFNQHREPAESGEVHIDALGKPLVTNSVSYMAPGQLNPLYKNIVAPLMEGWDADARHVGSIADPWSQWNDRVVAIGGFETGSYSRSEFGAGAATWRREIILVRPDVEHPVIVIRDTLAKPGEHMATFWLQTEGEIGTPGGPLTPPVRGCPATPTPTAEQSPSAAKVPGPLPAGVNTFRFRGHDWMKLYPEAFAKAGINDVGPVVDVDVHVVNAAPVEAVVGQWRTFDHGNRFVGGSSDDRQYLRVKFTGGTHTTVFTPFVRGKRPADLAVVAAGDEVTIRYAAAAGAKRAITVTATGYRVETEGTRTAAETFPTGMPTALYPGWQDLPYAGQVHPWGSPLSRLEVKDGPAWANGVYEQVPQGAVSGMLQGRDGITNPFARFATGGMLDTGKPCYRIVTGTRMAYLFALAGRGYLLARLPGAKGEEWLYEETAAATTPAAVADWRATTAEWTSSAEGRRQVGMKIIEPAP